MINRSISNMNSNVRKQKGFTLIEIAIVLVIIGLLVGGILQGQELIENSRVKQAVKDINGAAASLFAYKDSYGRFPGDDGPTATLTARGANWTGVTGPTPDGTLAVAVGAVFTGAGESGQFLQHLRAAGFISGNPANAGLLALPTNSWGGLVGVLSAVMGGGLNGNKICLSQVRQLLPLMASLMTVLVLLFACVQHWVPPVRIQLRLPQCLLRHTRKTIPIRSATASDLWFWRIARGSRTRRTR